MPARASQMVHTVAWAAADSAQDFLTITTNMKNEEATA